MNSSWLALILLVNLILLNLGVEAACTFAVTAAGSCTIPPGTTSIGVDAMADCLTVTYVTIPSSVKKIESNDFANCDNLVTVNIAGGLTEIGEGAFFGCIKLTTIDFPSSLKKIAGGAFYKAFALSKITFSDNPGLEEIGEQAFFMT